MYYDTISNKMIPGIFMVINNKTEEGYRDSFSYLKYYIDLITKYDESKLKLKYQTFTTDFEKALFKAFITIFNTKNEIKHIG